MKFFLKFLKFEGLSEIDKKWPKFSKNFYALKIILKLEKLGFDNFLREKIFKIFWIHSHHSTTCHLVLPGQKWPKFSKKFYTLKIILKLEKLDFGNFLREKFFKIR